MIDKRITLSIAGQEVVCNFGVNYFYKHFNEITGVDMLVDGLKDLASVKMFDIVPALYYAAYKAECSIKKEEPKIEKAVFDDHVLSMNEAGAAKMLTDYTNTINPAESGEAEAQTNP